MRRAAYLGHGVDYAHFASARPISGPAAVPESLGNLPRPIIGFYGALDDYTDRPVADDQSGACVSDATLLVIGPKQMDIAALEAVPNVRYVGPVPVPRPARFAAASTSR